MSTDTIIDNAIAEAPSPDAVVDNAAEVTNTTPKDGDAEAASDEVDVPFPKKAVNAISRRDKQIGKYKAERDALAAKLAQYEKPTTQVTQPNQLDPNKFDNYGEYLKAQGKLEAESEYSAKEKQRTEQELAAKNQQLMEPLLQNVRQTADELMKSNPEVTDLLIQNADIVDGYPDAIQQAFLEAKNPALAFAVLAKEGLLEVLATMTPYQASMAIARAEDRGAVMFKAKQVTKAPAPMAGAKGTGTLTKSLEDMSGTDIIAWVREQ